MLRLVRSRCFGSWPTLHENPENSPPFGVFDRSALAFEKNASTLRMDVLFNLPTDCRPKAPDRSRGLVGEIGFEATPPWSRTRLSQVVEIC